MKINFIEEPKNELEASKVTLSSILNEYELKQIAGGGPTCGYHTSCDRSGKSHCMPYVCDSKTSCTDIRTWSMPL